jgi:nucleoside-diphosphate-sugar epimerase
VFGNTPKDNSVIGRMINSAQTSGKIVVKGNGATLRDYLYLDDLANLISWMLRDEHAGLLNVVTGKSQSIIDTAKCIKKILYNKATIILNSDNDPRGFDLLFDNSNLTSLFPSFRFTKIEDALNTYKQVVD